MVWIKLLSAARNASGTRRYGPAARAGSDRLCVDSLVMQHVSQLSEHLLFHVNKLVNPFIITLYVHLNSQRNGSCLIKTKGLLSPAGRAQVKVRCWNR